MGVTETKKRSLMAKIADKNCKKIFITDDNPRKESPSKIRNMLVKHIQKDKVFNIGNRYAAIKKAIITAEQNEIILVAGKKAMKSNKFIKIKSGIFLIKKS